MVLRDGDTVAFGLYEIQVGLSDEPAADDADSAPARGPRPEDILGDRFTSDPFPLIDGDALEAARPSIHLPPDFDPLGRTTSSPNILTRRRIMCRR